MQVEQELELDGNAILKVLGSRIAAVGRANTVDVPAGAEVLDLSGEVALIATSDIVQSQNPAAVLEPTPVHLVGGHL